MFFDFRPRISRKRHGVGVIDMWGVALVILLASCTPSSPQLTVVVEHRLMGERQLYSVYPDGSHVALMAQLPMSGAYSVSPTGRYVANLAWPAQQLRQPLAPGTLTVTATYSQAIIDKIENAGETRFEEIPAADNIVWSPTGDGLAFLRNSAGSQGIDLWVYQLATRRSIKVTNTEAIIRAPQWSPDGKLIAFATQTGCKSDDTGCSFQDEYWDIGVVSLDGSYQKIITDLRHAKLPAFDQDPYPARDLCNLRWSPDGKFIAFENDCGWGPPGHKEVFLVTVDQTKTQQLTNLSSASAVGGGIMVSYTVQWSTSGDRLLIGFTQSSLGPPQPGKTFQKGLMIVQTSDFSISTVTTDVGSESSVSEDGQHIVWHSDVASLPAATFLGELGNHRLVNITFSTPLPDSACSTTPFRWSPDSQYVAYTMAEQNGALENCAEDRNRGVAVVSLRDSKVVNVAATLGGDNRLIGWLSTTPAQP
jgi:dipeptidyl aminopeptidase/acylaminoacyl peptidase